MPGVRPPSRRSGARTISPTQLRSMWRSASQERLWTQPDDWWVPAVDAVTEAIITDGDVAECCHRLGMARARAGVPMTETLDDVVALTRLVRALQSHPAHQFAAASAAISAVDIVSTTAAGWAEGIDRAGGFRVLQSASPGLSESAPPDISYLMERLREAAAESEYAGERLGERYALVVTSLPSPKHSGVELLDVQARVEAWDRTWKMAQLVTDLRSVFGAGESIVQTGPTTAAVLARRSAQLTARVAALRALIDDRSDAAASAPDVVALCSVSIWFERLPDSLQQAKQLLSELRR